MQFKHTTVLGLFDSAKKHFVIPVYQRAYSWEENQWKIFLTDLREQIASDNNYFYGNLLLEIIERDVKYEIIDGQQRLTTLVIFFRAMLDVLKKRSAANVEAKTEIEAAAIEFALVEEIYFKNRGNVKLQPVEYDRACFESLIVDGNTTFVTSTPSQEKIKKAKEYFTFELNGLSTTDLLKIFSKIQSTELTCIELNGKKDSALMFELQNNRGKDLTNMEKIKSYFMYQMYIHSPQDETETNIDYIAKVFKSIYQIVKDVKLEEDRVLIYHCNAFTEKGFRYRTIDDIKEVFKNSQDKIGWIKDFINELRTSFANIKEIEKSKLAHLEDLRALRMPAFVYPFILKGYKYASNSEDCLDTLYHILEVVVFRYQLIGSRAEIEGRLQHILLNFNEKTTLAELKNNIKAKLEEESYWSDKNMESYLYGAMYGNKSLNYLLWKYENSIQSYGCSILRIKIDEEQIEHISPQKPTNGDPMATGYEVNEKNEYSEDFVRKKLNCVGNLMLISRGHNQSIGNQPFSMKLSSYKNNPLLRQQAEIVNFTDPENSPNKWGIAEIDKRCDKIVAEFALPKWSFDSIVVPEM